jgi:riboflavin kinase/FMN adenylyltransferase
LNGEHLRAAVNIGLRPTVSDAQTIPNLEAYLLDFDGQIYGEPLELQFIARLRDELKFPSLEALIEQMHKDVADTRQLLS